MSKVYYIYPWDFKPREPDGPYQVIFEDWKAEFAFILNEFDQFEDALDYATAYSDMIPDFDARMVITDTDFYHAYQRYKRKWEQLGYEDEEEDE